jgi:hypothetical protein
MVAMSDGFWKVVCANGKAIIPTVARLGVARGGNQKARAPDLSLPSPVARAAGFKSERAFEEKARGWAIERRSGVYRIIPHKRRRDRGWEEDDENAVELPTGASEAMVAAHLIDVIKSTVGNM